MASLSLVDGSLVGMSLSLFDAATFYDESDSDQCKAVYRAWADVEFIGDEEEEEGEDPLDSCSHVWCMAAVHDGGSTDKAEVWRDIDLLNRYEVNGYKGLSSCQNADVLSAIINELGIGEGGDLTVMPLPDAARILLDAASSTVINADTMLLILKKLGEWDAFKWELPDLSVHDGIGLVFRIHNLLASKKTINDDALQAVITQELDWKMTDDPRHARIFDFVASSKHVDNGLLERLLVHALSCASNHSVLMRAVSGDPVGALMLSKLEWASLSEHDSANILLEVGASPYACTDVMIEVLKTLDRLDASRWSWSDPIDGIDDGFDLIFRLHDAMSMSSHADVSVLDLIIAQETADDPQALCFIEAKPLLGWRLYDDSRHIGVMDHVVSNTSVNAELLHWMLAHALRCSHSIEHEHLFHQIAGNPKTSEADLQQLASIGYGKAEPDDGLLAGFESVPVDEGAQARMIVDEYFDKTARDAAAKLVLMPALLIEEYGVRPRLFVRALRYAVQDGCSDYVINNASRLIDRANALARKPSEIKERRRRYLEEDGGFDYKDMPDVVAFARKNRLTKNKDLFAWLTGDSYRLTASRRHRLFQTAKEWITFIASHGSSYGVDLIFVKLCSLFKDKRSALRPTDEDKKQFGRLIGLYKGKYKIEDLTDDAPVELMALGGYAYIPTFEGGGSVKTMDTAELVDDIVSNASLDSLLVANKYGRHPRAYMLALRKIIRDTDMTISYEVRNMLFLASLKTNNYVRRLDTGKLDTQILGKRRTDRIEESREYRRYEYLHKDGNLWLEDCPDLLAYADRWKLPKNQDLLGQESFLMELPAVRKHRAIKTIDVWIRFIAAHDDVDDEDAYASDLVLYELYNYRDYKWHEPIMSDTFLKKHRRRFKK